MLVGAWYRTFGRPAFANLYRCSIDLRPCKGLVCTTTSFVIYEETRGVDVLVASSHTESPYDPANQTPDLALSFDKL